MRDPLRFLLFSLTLLAAASVAAQEVSSNAVAKDPLLPQPKLTRIMAEYKTSDAAARIAGSGLGIGERKSVDAQGRELVWREFQRDTDQRGGVHVTYKQYLVGNGVDAELFGSGMSVHYESNGDVAFVEGVQFEKVKIANTPRMSGEEASRRAVRHVRTFTRAGVERDVERGTPTDPQLKLVQFGDEFRFAFFASTVDDNGVPQRVIFDAENDRLLARAPLQMNGNCSATAGTLVRANSFPVRPDVNARIAHQATLVPAGTRPEPFTHEGRWDYSGVKMTVFQYLDEAVGGPLTPFKCDPAVRRSYTVFPVQADVAGGVPVYRDRPSPGARQWAGNAAGDALWNTYQTMRTFVGFGRKGWDNRNSPANVFVDYTRRSDQAVFNYLDGYMTAVEPTMPTGVYIGQPNHYYALSSSLDLIAHEFGHGVVFTTAGWAYVTNQTAPSELALHEGWSDVIAMIVEKRRQPSGYGPEQRDDWYMHEDSGVDGYSRGARDDGAGHTWTGVDGFNGYVNGQYLFNDKVHKDDFTGTEVRAHNVHETGNVLNMMHRMLADGGRNSACSRLGKTEAECPTMTGLGYSKAGLILFQALQYRVRWWHTMDNMMDAVKQEAFNQYNGCAYDPLANAAAEQEAVIKAFANIGYPGINQTIIQCN